MKRTILKFKRNGDATNHNPIQLRARAQRRNRNLQRLRQQPLPRSPRPKAKRMCHQNLSGKLRRRRRKRKRIRIRIRIRGKEGRAKPSRKMSRALDVTYGRRLENVSIFKRVLTSLSSCLCSKYNILRLIHTSEDSCQSRPSTFLAAWPFSR